MRIAALCLGLIFLGICGPAASAQETATASDGFKSVRMAQVRMGVPIQIVMYADSEEHAEQAARKAFDRIGELDAICSDYRADSELSRLCREVRPGQPMPVSPDLFRLLQQSAEVSRLSDGAFDVTVAPLVSLWRQARKERRMPAPEKLAAARELVGWSGITLDAGSQTATFHRPGIRLDLGGIAKGYATQAALKVLEQEGIACAMVDAGGDMTLGTPPPGRKGWRIQLQTTVAPSTKEQQQRDVLELARCAIATSGDAYQFVEIDGVRHSHIIDPRTGLGVTTHGTVTVIDADAALADAWASALSVLGPEEGLAAAEAAGLTALIATRPLNASPDVAESRIATTRWIKRFGR